MRSRRIAVWTATIVGAVGIVGGGSAAALTGSSSAENSTTSAYVTCVTPVETVGDVTISAARADRGTTIPDAAPDETCTVTE